MCFLKTTCLIFLVIFHLGKIKGLLGPGNSSDPTHSPHGHNLDIADILSFLQNQTTQMKNLNQSTMKELENLKQQAENDRSSIQSLQNRVFFLEAELGKLNASKPDSGENLSTYLMSMNHLIQNMAVNEELDQNLTQRMNAVDKHLDDLNVQVRYTSLSLLDLHTKTKELNGSLNQLLREKTNDVNSHSANVFKKIGFTASLTQRSSTWNSGTLVFPNVITNVGNGYNPSDGVFTAPVAGVYTFFVTVYSNGHSNINVDIMLNGVQKVRTMAYNSGQEEYDVGLNLAVFNLNVGDRVWIKYNGGVGYYSDSSSETTFSGFSI